MKEEDKIWVRDVCTNRELIVLAIYQVSAGIMIGTYGAVLLLFLFQGIGRWL